MPEPIVKPGEVNGKKEPGTVGGNNPPPTKEPGTVGGNNPPPTKEPGTVGLQHPTVIETEDGSLKVLTPLISIIITPTGAVDIMVYKTSEDAPDDDTDTNDPLKTKKTTDTEVKAS